MTTDTAITNFSLFSPNKFLIVIQKFPGVNFFAQSIELPNITLGQSEVNTNRYVNYYVPGDRIQFDDLTIEFLLDEDFVAYSQIKDWMISAASSELKNDSFSDLQIIALTNNSNNNKTIAFHNTFPFSITSIPMDTTKTENEVITVTVTFKYSDFEIS